MSVFPYNKLHADNQKDLRERALRYAEADKSDPFTYSRCMSHLRNGVAGMLLTNNGMVMCTYTAERDTEERTLPNGMKFSNDENKYHAVVYRNIKRP